MAAGVPRRASRKSCLRVRAYFSSILILISYCSVLTLGKASALGASPQTVTLGGGTIDVSLPSGTMKVSQSQLMTWVQRAATAVTTYYGRFPVKHLTLKIGADDRAGVHHGVTYPDGGGLIEISVGRDTSEEDLQTDWMLTHEMIHLAFPSMPHRQHWIEEGISVYVEPVARVQADELSAREMWYETLRDMAQGEPQAGDEGLDYTHTWGRTYWGGAMFCQVADVRIREQTRNKKGLEDALRRILDASGGITADWQIEHALAVGDQATGTHVLMDLYHQMRDQPDDVDLDAIWKKLGVSMVDKTVRFNDHAPDAAIREEITRKP